jgi:hypothetical protein
MLLCASVALPKCCYARQHYTVLSVLTYTKSRKREREKERKREREKERKREREKERKRESI